MSLCYLCLNLWTFALFVCGKIFCIIFDIKSLTEFTITNLYHIHLKVCTILAYFKMSSTKMFYLPFGIASKKISLITRRNIVLLLKLYMNRDRKSRYGNHNIKWWNLLAIKQLGKQPAIHDLGAFLTFAKSYIRTLFWSGLIVDLFVYLFICWRLSNYVEFSRFFKLNHTFKKIHFFIYWFLFYSFNVVSS